MCENGLIKLEVVDNRPNSQKECLTLWLGWFLKIILKSKCILAQYVEEYKIREWDGEETVWEGNKTKDLMKKWEEFKDGRTPFGNWIFMEGIGEGWYTKSLTMSSLFSFEMLVNSTTDDCISSSLSCLICSLSSNSFLSFNLWLF